ncbi:hypothetical protein COV24_04855 [candidate division WWE3 bacterium CG10_big_fil_rev_8_21_14_0_10_32_10]|uniref:Uncharacterized protein n=1 Tax=candidate division WWE3 bacterium CG10_big_fil_rev_8_21_14_0_10_32_10 TaxID=1975090 RepID=A0A2H0R9J7_UNCKA|nr:MAG: hypothetical protein COV24_04855 [candidate division WWE3 bacterium CG10_big_fil_rev_8_21_14_0_10_32_10]
MKKIIFFLSIFSIISFFGTEKNVLAEVKTTCNGGIGIPFKGEWVDVKTAKFADGQTGLKLDLGNLENTSEYKIELKDPGGGTTEIQTISGKSTYSLDIPINVPGDYSINLKKPGTSGIYYPIVSNCETQKINLDPNNTDIDLSTPAPPGSGQPGTPGSSSSSSASAGNTGNLDASKYVVWAYKFLLPFVIAIAVIRLLIFTIALAASQGDPTKLNEAKENIYATLMGLLVIGGAVTIINILGSALGI